jgi:hypothetical protein
MHKEKYFPQVSTFGIKDLPHRFLPSKWLPESLANLLFLWGEWQRISAFFIA